MAIGFLAVLAVFVSHQATAWATRKPALALALRLATPSPSVGSVHILDILVLELPFVTHIPRFESAQALRLDLMVITETSANHRR